MLRPTRKYRLALNTGMHRPSTIGHDLWLVCYCAELRGEPVRVLLQFAGGDGDAGFLFSFGEDGRTTAAAAPNRWILPQASPL